MRLALGTVQFGMPYGIANTCGKVPGNEVRDILRTARTVGLDTLDTAMTYGESESVLGRVGVHDWKCISKLPPIPEGLDDVATWVRQQVHGSLARLQQPCLYALLLHRPLQLLGPRGADLWRALERLKSEGMIQKWGVSVYTPEELVQVFALYCPDLVQAPLNLVDQRLMTSGWLHRLAFAGVEVHARSVFMQGLLLMPGHTRPSWFSRWQVLWDRWQAWLRDHPGLSPLAVCQSFVLSCPGIDRLVVGVDSLQQFQQVLQAHLQPSQTWPDLASDDPLLLNPMNWRTS